ncbi:MAG: shikimate kinase [Bacteroidetes bacterium]|nr:shikimate kinase [Bacteroidota bacterium]
MKPVFIIGFMGAGKSTHGKKLATALQRSFVDLDDVVARALAIELDLPPAPLAALIAQAGMDRFREVERDELRHTDWKHVVIATGGGTPCFYNNLNWMKEHGLVVFLDTPAPIVLGRLRQSNLEERPMLKGLDDAALQQTITGLLVERLPYYKQAHLRFEPSTETIPELALRIKRYSETI